MIRELILLVAVILTLVDCSLYDPSDYNYNGHYGLQSNPNPYISDPGFLSQSYPESQYYPYQHFPETHQPNSYNPNQSGQEIKGIHHDDFKHGNGKKRTKFAKISKKNKKKTKYIQSQAEEELLMTIYERPKFIVDPVKLTKKIEKRIRIKVKKVNQHKKKIPLICKKFHRKLVG